ncbi:MAG: efflux RND transporter periplasmic adaptor subunit, partial [Planctomycetota bacterium]
AAGGGLAWQILASAEGPVTTPPELPAPLVRAVQARQESVRFDVLSHGTVTPRTESSLVPQVPGRVEWVSPSFVAGGFFEQGQALLRLDKRDHELAVVAAQADVAQAEMTLALEQSECDVAREEWEAREQGEAGDLVLRVPQLARAQAGLAAAEAALERARLDLGRTTISAPYAGRVRQRSVDRGAYVQPGQRLAVLYAVDQAEIRLPVPDSELAFLDLPLAYRGEAPPDGHLPVTVRAVFAGRGWSWQGRVVRTEGEIDPTNRMLHLVVAVDDPYGSGGEPGRPPLAVGMFVECVLHGRKLPEAIVLPSAALRKDDYVFVVQGGRLQRREVQLLRRERERVVLSGGVQPGELVCTSILEVALDGMTVRLDDQLP